MKDKNSIMIFKPYQTKVVSSLKEYFRVASELKQTMKNLPNLQNFDWVHSSITSVGLVSVSDSPRNGLGQLYPRLTIKVPTGGGKTLLAVETIRQYQELFANRKTGLVIWVVPSEIIYSQTVDRLRDKADPYRQLLDQASNNHTLIIEKGQELRMEDVEENLVVLMLMIQSVSRASSKESLKVFTDSGSYNSFFPEDNRYDLHKELLEKVPNLDVFQGVSSFMPLVKTSLGNVIRLTNPLIIIDEIHRVFTDTAKGTIDGLNPAMVIGFSATPKSEMNILISISGQELKECEMIKLDMNVKEPTHNEDWQTMVKEIKDYRETIEITSKEYDANTGNYIRPIALIQVERTGPEQRGKGWVHSEDVKDYLKDIGVPEEEIAIKTSSVNDIENINLLSKDCIIRYIITKDALKEGWDCPFAYILGIIPNVNSNTGVTQLVGRVLRQPFGRKTGIQILDECYVYYCNGHTQSIITSIVKGFKEEGLDDLASGVNIQAKGKVPMKRMVKVKEEYRSKYPDSLYLPVWLIKLAKDKYRKFSYGIDIKPKINFEIIDYPKLVGSIVPAIGNESFSTGLTRIDINKGELITESSSEVRISEVKFDIEYLTRRLNEYIENAFLSRKMAIDLYKVLVKKISEKDLGKYNGFVISEIIKEFEKVRDQQEKVIFDKLVKDKTIILAVSNEEIGFKLPDSEPVLVNNYNTYKYYLYEDFDITSINGLEQDVAKLLDNQKNILWWVRNKATKGWYVLSGWKPERVRPDFVVARKNSEGKLDLIYVIESKGAHLEGNVDTTYKNDLFKFMNSTSIEKLETQSVVKAMLNDQFYYELVTQDRFENQISSVMIHHESNNNS